MDVGPVELLIVLAVVLLLFGSKKLPELAKGMGQAAKEFRSGLHESEPAPAETKVATATDVDSPVDSPADSPVDTNAVDTNAVDTKAIEATPPGPTG